MNHKIDLTESYEKNNLQEVNYSVCHSQEKREGGLQSKGFIKKTNSKDQLISVVTVCFNEKYTLRSCINSVLNQKYENVEYIVIDGASTDGSVDIIKSYEDSISYFISEPDGGIYDAMNKGLELTSGDWIIFLNADDEFFDSQSLKKIVQGLKDPKKTYFGRAYVRHNGRILYKKPNLYNEKWLNHYIPIHQTVLLSALHKNKKFDTTYKISADSIYLYNLSLVSEFEFLPVDMVYFSLGGKSSQFINFNGCLVHIKEHIQYLKLRKAPFNKIFYIYVAFLSKYFLGRIFHEEVYFEIVSVVSKIKARFTQVK
jgi:glycosyltransferase involved in cell wall biosynthesis